MNPKRAAATLAHASAVALLLGLTAAPVPASTYPDAERYFAVRGRSPVVTAHPEQVTLRPAAFRGKLIEIRGAVTGVARRTGGATFIVKRPDEQTYVIDAAPEPDEGIELGQIVRVLARVGDGAAADAGAAPAGGAGQLIFVAAVSEYEAASLEQERARKAAAAARKQPSRKVTQPESALRARQARQQLASRSYSILDAYTAAVLYFNRRLTPEEARSIAYSIIHYSSAHGLDARLVMAVIAVESNFNAGAVSPKGAMGLGQLMPSTAQDLGVDPWNPHDNIRGATRLLGSHLQRMGGPAGVVTEEKLALALACYNAGLGAVRKHKGVPPYRETKNYVRRVTRLYRQMCGLSE